MAVDSRIFILYLMANIMALLFLAMTYSAMMIRIIDTHESYDAYGSGRMDYFNVNDEREGTFI